MGWIAALIALWGLLALALGIDPIPETDAGPYLGPVQSLAATIIVLVALLRTSSGSAPASTAAAGAASVYLAMLVVGAIGYALVVGDAAVAILFLGSHATSPFTIGAALLVVPAVLLERLVVVRAGRSARDGRSFDPPDARD